MKIKLLAFKIELEREKIVQLINLFNETNSKHEQKASTVGGSVAVPVAPAILVKETHPPAPLG